MHIACVFLFGAVVAVITGADLIIRPAGESFTKAVGGSIVMTCTIPVINRTVGSMSVDWLDKNGIEVSSRVGRMYVESESAVTKKLYITGIQNSDAGLYTCRASTGVELLQKSIELQLFKEITFEDTPLAQSVAMHSDAIIVCRATGNPLPDVSWRFRGHRILEGERYVQVVGGLKILGVTRSDDGEYTCRAEVEVDGRYDERRIIVSVHITPKMKMEVGDSEGVQGTDFYLSCAADGFPAPTYKFYKDGSLLVSSNRIQVNEVAGNVYFSPLHKDDEGSYNCSASNDVGTATSTGSLLVLVPPSIFGVVDAETIEGQSATLSCQSQGDPVPEMSFHKDGQQSAYQLGLNVGGAMVSSPKIGHLQLTFENVTPSDSANYTCRSRNAVGMDERLVTLLVQFKPRFHVNHSVQAFVWAGRPRNVTCRVNSHPASVIEWFRNGKRIEQNDTFRVHQTDHMFESTSFLQIRIREADQVWIYGSFECRAKNFLGTASINIELKRASAPDAPKSVSVVNRLPTELVLFAAPPDEDGGMPVTGYRVEFEDQVQDFKIDEVPLRITGLRPSTKYMLRVRAVSEVGAGNPVLETVITENIRRPYPIVIDSEPQGTEPYEYTVTWNMPATGGLAITLYEFQYRRVKVEDGTFNFTEPLEDWTSYSVHDNPDRPMLYHKVIDLEPDSHYELVVEARNSLGKSDPSARFIFLTASGGDALPAHKRSSLDWNVVIGVVVVMLIVFLIIIDFSCYFMNSCGVTMFLCVHVCGRQHRRSGQRGIEEGESEKKPLSDDVPPDVETMATYQSRPMRLPPLPTEDEEDRDGVFSHSGSERTESHRRVPSVLTDHELR